MIDIYFKLHRSLFLYALALAIGCYAYFIVPETPSLLNWLSICLFWVSLSLVIFYVTYRVWGYISSILCLFLVTGCFFVGGMSWTVFVMSAHNVKTLSKPIKHVAFKAKLLNVEATAKGWRFLLKPTFIEDMQLEYIPNKIRVTSRVYTDQLLLGQSIQGKAVLYPPHLPITPHGFQSHRWAYLQKIGALGWIYDVEIVSSTPAQSTSFAQFRLDILHYLKQLQIPLDEKAMLLALLMGEKSAIPASVQTVFQQVGLSHLLAISGLHMGLIIGFAILLGRFCLQLFPSWITRYDTKIPAIVISLLCGTGYLFISGCSPSAMRAFIMCSLVAVAIMSGRQIFSIRTVSLTAIFLLLYHPALILNIGFQLSFMAVLGLVICMPYLQASQLYLHPLLRYIWLGMMTSLIASVTTIPIILGHFQIASFQAILSNFCAVPLTALFILPVAFIGLLLTICEYGSGLLLGGNLILEIAAYGCSTLLFWAQQIADLSLGVWRISEVLPLTFILIVSAIFIVYLGCIIGQYQKKSVPVLAIISCGICILAVAVIYQKWHQADLQIWVSPRHPYILIADQHQTSVIYGKIVKKQRAKKSVLTYAQRQWQVALGQVEIAVIDRVTLDEMKSDLFRWQCNQEICDLWLKANPGGKPVLSLIFSPKGATHACQKRDGMIVTLYHIRQSCPTPKILIDALELAQNGTHWISVSQENIFITKAVEIYQHRQWGSQ